MATPGLKVAFFDRFDGGLNNKQQRQDLLTNETPDCMDVVFNARGGFSTRRGVNSTAWFGIGGEVSYVVGQFSAGTEVLWGIDKNGGLWTYDGSTLTGNGFGGSASDLSRTVRGTAWGNKLYLSNWLTGGSLLMRYWNGAAFTTMTNVANNNYTAPTGGNAPLARLIADHSGHMWWADTVEAGTRYRSRLRFSHPLQPEDFAAADYFDIEPDDQTNQITALVPFRNMLLVFKQRGVFAVYGTDRSNFVVERVSTQSGVYSQEGVSANAGVCYWWSTDGDVYAFNGKGVVPIGQRITNVVTTGVVSPGGDHRVCWADNQLYVSLATATGGRVCFMYDPNVGKTGAWTQFSFTPTSMFWWRKNGGAAVFQFTVSAKTWLYDLGSAAQEQDEFADGVFTPIPAYYKTAWFTADDTALKKKWRRPTVTVACNDNATLNVDAYYDFNESSPTRQLTLPITAASGAMVWGDNWGSIWSGSDPVYVFERLGSLGRSHAIQLKFRVTDHASRWWIDSVAIPYLEKAYR